MFAELAFEVLHPGEQLLNNWHIGVLAYQLSQFMAETHNRLIINLPPRTLKSFMTSIAMPAFLLGKNPRLKVLLLAGTPDLASDLRQKVLRLLRSDRYGGVFDDMEFSVSDRRIDFAQGGSLSFLKYGESIIGKGYDVIIIDDPQSPSQVEDADKRRQAGEYFKNDVLHRLNSKTQGRIVIVQQRLHEDDLTGCFFHKREWRCLAISAISRDIERWPTPRNGFVTRDKGIALCEPRESKQTIEEQLAVMGPAKFAAQYLQAPRLGVVNNSGTGIAWWVPPDWDGKSYIGWALLKPLDPADMIRALYFDGPRSHWVFQDPNPPLTSDEFQEKAISQQAALVQRVREDADRWMASRPIQ